MPILIIHPGTKWDHVRNSWSLKFSVNIILLLWPLASDVTTCICCHWQIKNSSLKTNTVALTAAVAFVWAFGRVMTVHSCVADSWIKDFCHPEWQIIFWWYIILHWPEYIELNCDFCLGPISTDTAHVTFQPNTKPGKIFARKESCQAWLIG
jgi:hypothetical protein